MPVRLPFFVLRICVFVGMLLTVQGCGNPENELKKRIRLGAAKDATFDNAEWKTLTDWVEEHPKELANLVSNGKTDCGKLRTYAAELLKKPALTAPCGGSVALRPAVKVFLENSVSMDGYISGKTDFEAVLIRLLGSLGTAYGENRLRFNFINSRNTIPQPFPSGNFDAAVKTVVDNLDPNAGSWKIHKGGGSELDKVINDVLLQTDPNTLTVLISDFIYTLGAGTSTASGLESMKSAISNAFDDKSGTTALLVWQLKSDFNGTYYAGVDAAKTFPWGKTQRKIRPYYIWFMGSPEVVRQLMGKMNTGNFKGFENRLTFFPNAGPAVEPFASVVVLDELGKEGEFQLDTKDKSRLTLRNVNPALGPIQFSLAVDLSQVPADEAYQTDAKNYQTSSGFRVTKVEKITEDLLSRFSATGAGSSAKKRLQSSSATHLLTLRADRNFPKQNITIRLNDQLPAWVAASHTANDSAGPDADHTFGLKYLIDGVSQAYKPTGEAPALARFTVKIN